MTERDAFELRFASAVGDHVGRVTSDLDPVELAHRIAAAEPRRRGLALTWRDAAIPQRLWVPLMLAALLAALVGGMLIAGSLPEPMQLPAVVPTAAPTALAVSGCPLESSPDQPGPVDQVRPLQAAEFDTLAVVDSREGRLVAVVDTGDDLETWTFDICRNVWTQMHPAVQPPRFDWGQLVYDVDSGVTILADAGSIWAYDLPSDTWTSMGPIGIQAGSTSVTLWAYDQLTGLVVAGTADGAGLWNYAVETNRWTPIPGRDAPPGGLAVYDASVDRVVFPFDMGLFDLRTGAWSSTQAQTPQIIAGYGMSPPALVYDASARRTVAIGNQRLAAYDATADRWEVVLDIADLLPLPVADDPVNKRLIGLGRGGIVGYGGVVALDLATRTWTVLLPAKDGQGLPSSG